MKIANIISQDNIDLPLEFNKIADIENKINNLPTLIVGWYNTKALYPNQDILNRKINNNTFWMFKKTENRNKYESELIDFIEFSYKELVKDIQYFFIDPLHISLNHIKKILKLFNENNNIISFKYKDMIYLYVNKVIFGIDLRLMKFLTFNIDKLVNKIKNKSTVFLDKTDIIIEYKGYIEKLNDEIKYIPYLYFLNNYEQNSTPSLIHLSRTS